MPDSLRELDKIVSFTAAKTSLILLVSVAWVRLHKDRQYTGRTRTSERKKSNVLRIYTQFPLVLLCKFPQDELGGLLDVRTACIFSEMVWQRNLARAVSKAEKRNLFLNVYLWNLLAEDIHLIEEKDDRRSNKPLWMNNAIEKNKWLDKTVLCQASGFVLAGTQATYGCLGFKKPLVVFT